MKLYFEGRMLNKAKKTVKKINDLASRYAEMSDERLSEETAHLKYALANGKTLDDLLPYAYAAIREASKRVLGMYPYDVQMLAGVVLNDGDIAQQNTGEGKTLTSVMPVYLNALTGDGVHVVTVNEYLSQRDKELMGPVFEFMGLSVGLNVHDMSRDAKREAYACDITYTSNAELGFDYLRDNMVKDIKQKVQRGLNFALVDEVDSILIDDARTPLIISGKAENNPALYREADSFAKSLSNGDYKVDRKSNTVVLTDSGIDKAERMFHLDNLYDLKNSDLLHRIDQAMKANYTLTRDKDYVADRGNDEVLIIDSNTGRTMKGREWSDGLHQAVCAKEGITIRDETITVATITYQNFFRLYNKLAGMTGTAKTEEEEFREIYNMLVLEIPTNKPVQRIDNPDLIYGTKKAKYEAIVNEVKERHAKGQPVLVGTIAVETSELLSEMLKKQGIQHEVLNAKNHAREAEIVARAGQKYAVTIATNMAGRGTDIKLGEGVKELGGLYVIGSERHDSRRIDNQLRGRSGRQGDPGESRFFVSVQDDLMVRFGSERMEQTFASLGDEAVESKLITKSITSAQKRVEGLNFDARKTLLDYDDVMRQQREIIYQERNEILETDDIHKILKKQIYRAVKAIVIENCSDNALDKEGLLQELEDIYYCEDYRFRQVNFDVRSVKDVKRLIKDIYKIVWERYENKLGNYADKMIPHEKKVVLTTLDNAWTEHIDTMDKLRTGIGLRAYAQNDPLLAYKEEGFALFKNMSTNIAKEIFRRCMKTKVVVFRVEKPLQNVAIETIKQTEMAG